MAFSAVNSMVPKHLAASCHVSMNGNISAFAAVPPSVTSGGPQSRPIAFAIPAKPLLGYDAPQSLASDTLDALYHEYLVRYAEEIGLEATEVVLRDLEKLIPRQQALIAPNWKIQGSKTDQIIVGPKSLRKETPISTAGPLSFANADDALERAVAGETQVGFRSITHDQPLHP